MRFMGVLLGIMVIPLFSQPVLATEYVIDAEHTAISFKIRHLVTRVAGQFRRFEGSFIYAPEAPETWKVEAKIEASSIDTNVKERDDHLKSPDFFHVKKFPEIIFKSNKIIDISQESAKIYGTLTMRGVSKPIVLDLEIHGVGEDPWGITRAGFTATTKVNRKDFGLSWNETLETGKLLVGEEVKITLEIEGILKK